MMRFVIYIVFPSKLLLTPTLVEHVPTLNLQQPCRRKKSNEAGFQYQAYQILVFLCYIDTEYCVGKEERAALEAEVREAFSGPGGVFPLAFQGIERFEGVHNTIQCYLGRQIPGTRVSPLKQFSQPMASHFPSRYLDTF